MAQALQSRLESIDVSDPRLYQDDTWRPVFARLRRDDPVHYCEASAHGPYWSVTRYDDIFTVELDHETYSSASELGGIQVADHPRGRSVRTSFVWTHRDIPRNGALSHRLWRHRTLLISRR